MYTVANSIAMKYNDYGPRPYWMYIMFGVDVLVLACAVWYFRRRRIKMKLWKIESSGKTAGRQDNV